MNYRPRADLDDNIDSLFDHEEAARRRRDRDEMIANHRSREQAEVSAAAKRKVAFVEEQRLVNMAMIRREYASFGVEPPRVNAAGEPTCGLGLLFSLGWKIEQDAYGKNVLIAGEDYRNRGQPLDDSKQGTSNDEHHGERGSGRGRGSRRTSAKKTTSEGR